MRPANPRSDPTKTRVKKGQLAWLSLRVFACPATMMKSHDEVTRVAIVPADSFQDVALRWRRIVSAIGLGAAIANALLWLTLHAIWIGGFQREWGVEWVRYNPETSIEILDFHTKGFRPVLLWWRVGVWSSVLAIVASSVGRGKVRKFGLSTAVVTFVVWLFRGHS